MAAPTRTRDRARLRVDAVRRRLSGSLPEAIWAELKAVDFFDRTTIIGAELLWSALPFLILLSSLANARIDDDLSRHIGLDARGAHIVEHLFRAHPAHDVVAIGTGLVISFAGIVSVISSVQGVYEHLYHQERRGWRHDLWRHVLWTAVLVVLFAAEAASNSHVRRAAGSVGEAVAALIVLTAFFTWTIHFLLHGRIDWRRVVPPAITTAALWIGLAVVSSLYFAPMLVDDSKTYGQIGVVFTFLTWFIAISIVVVLGAVIGAVWETRRLHRGRNSSTSAG